MTYVNNIDLKYNLVTQEQLAKRLVSDGNQTKQKANAESDAVVPIPATPKWVPWYISKQLHNRM